MKCGPSRRHTFHHITNAVPSHLVELAELVLVCRSGSTPPPLASTVAPKTGYHKLARGTAKLDQRC